MLVLVVVLGEEEEGEDCWGVLEPPIRVAKSEIYDRDSGDISIIAFGVEERAL